MRYTSCEVQGLRIRLTGIVRPILSTGNEE
jgi:hypothetical protein